MKKWDLVESRVGSDGLANPEVKVLGVGAVAPNSLGHGPVEKARSDGALRAEYRPAIDDLLGRSRRRLLRAVAQL